MTSLSSSSLADFCTTNNILWFPINLTIDGKTKTLESISHPLYNGRPKMTDFKDLSEETIKKRQALLLETKWSKIFNCIAMDTTQIKHIDIDTPTYDEGFDEIMAQTPYFKSMTKSYGRHILIKFDDYEVETKRMQFQCNQVELLCGQWSYAPLQIFNADKEIMILTNIKDMLKTSAPIVKKSGCLIKTFKPISPSPNSVVDVAEIEEFDVNDSEIKKLLIVIGANRCNDAKHTEWNAVGQAIKNETKDEGLSDFVNWTNKYGTINKRNEAIVQYQKHIKYTPKSDKKRLTLGSLHYWAKLDNPDAYFLAFPQKVAPTVDVGINLAQYEIINETLNATSGDYSYAVAFNKLYNGKYVCVEKLKKEFYHFNDKSLLWEFDVGGSPIRNKISTEFRDIYVSYQSSIIEEFNNLEPNSEQSDKLNKKIKMIAELATKLVKTNDKNNIMSELSDICKNAKFASTLNKSEYMLPTNDGKILDMRTLQLINRTINDKFTFECNAKLIQLTDDEKFTKVDTYFNNLFCGNLQTKQCVINILKSVFIGKPLRYIYFCIGNGCNGKSLLFKILNKIFGGFMDIISESVIIEQKGNKSALNTEIEKLDKCRLGYVTELKETDKLNEKVIKQISGGDAINLRTLQTKDHTINPTCNTFVLTNEFPSFNGEAKSNLDRMIVIPFQATFKIDSEFEKEMLQLSDYIFSYIMHNGLILDKFELSDEIIEEATKHAKNNTDTTLEDYLNEYLVDCVNDKKDNKLIVLNDLRIAFENHCIVNKLKNSLGQKKFTSKLKSMNYVIKESNGKTMLYNKKFKTESVEEEE